MISLRTPKEFSFAKDGFKPFVQRNFRVLENGAGDNGELLVAGFLSAFVAAIRHVDFTSVATMRASRFISPALLSKELFAVLFVGVVAYKL